MSQFVYTATHTILYNTKKPVPIAQVIEALQALEGLLKDVPRVIQGLTDSEIQRAEFFIEKVEIGSLTEKILVKLFFKDEEEFEKFLSKIRENGAVRNTIVGLALGAIISYGLYYLASVNNSPSANITANNNTIINIGAGEVKLTPEAFSAIVESAIKDRQQTTSHAVRFLAPTRNDNQSTVQISGEDMPSLEITRGAISETPSKPTLPKNQWLEDISQIQVELRATDLDSKKSGWAGKIDGKTDRVKIELDPAVSESEIFGKQKITADVTIIHTMAKQGIESKPSRICIRKIY